jgi:hypothetical protein
MKDGIIKGTGNSRFLKSITGVKELYPTYEDFLKALEDGTFPIDLNGINADGWQQQGTLLTKETLLPDSICNALGVPAETTTPGEVLEKCLSYFVTGSYVGTGTITSEGTGESLSITFPFVPDAWGIYMIKTDDSRGNLHTTFGNITKWDLDVKYLHVNNGTSGSTGRVSLSVQYSGNTVSYYYPGGTNDAQICFNASGYTYYYIGIKTIKGGDSDEND